MALTATEARKIFFDLIKDVSEKHHMYHIHHRKGNVVLISEDEYEGLLETLDLLSIPNFRKSIVKSVKQIEKGETFLMEEVFGEKEK